MRSVGLDTCVVLRLLVGEPIDQAKQAIEYVETCYFAGITVYISDLVVAEAYHALCYHYQVPLSEAVKTMFNFLSSPMITPCGHALAVITEYKGTGAGLIDRLIRMDLLDQANEVITFDKTFSKLPNVSKL